MTDKKVTLELVGLDGNAFALMRAFRQQARKEGWTKEEIDEVLEECKSGDYNHLLCTLMEYCQSPEDNEDDFEDEEVEYCDDCGEEIDYCTCFEE